MDSLENRQIVVTGGSRGLGLGIVEALVARGAKVTVVARDKGRLAEVGSRLGVATIAGDVADESLAVRVIRDVRPSVIVLNAGAAPRIAPIHEQTWDSFSAVWNTDVKATFFWSQAALALPLEQGSRVLIGSSGAAVHGSPISGGYAGAKRMQWMMASYLNDVSTRDKLGIRFQALLPMQLAGETELGRAAAQGYANRRGVTLDEMLASFGTPMPPAKVGAYVVEILTSPAHEATTAFGLKGDGIRSLDA